MDKRTLSNSVRGTTGFSSILSGSLRNALLASTALTLMLPAAGPARAQDATWLTSPGSGDFFDANNWTPNSVPTGTATFGTSSTTTLTLGSSGTYSGWTFNTGASNYTFNISGGTSQGFTGTGIAINGGSAGIGNFGSLSFANTSTAGNAAITNSAGTLEFLHSSTAGSATISNDAFHFFRHTSTAGSANITNSSSLNFQNSSTAGNATITNNGGVVISDTSTAGSATITNAGSLVFLGSGTAGSATITGGGPLYFFDTTTAGNAAITNRGFMEFRNSSTAGSAGITNDGSLVFYDTTTAGNATITNNATAFLSFNNASTAGSATITNRGFLIFYGSSTAASATITNIGTGIVAVAFTDTSTAGSATITGNNTLDFSNSSTADSATIINDGGVRFFNTSTAGSATITSNHSLRFRNTSTAGSATITTTSGATINLQGLGTRFRDDSTGGTSRHIVDAGGLLDITEHNTGVTIGSLEGAGVVGIGGKTLTIGANNLSTLFSGIIQNLGNQPGSGTRAGSLVKTGSGTLTLTGANTYTGGTTITSASSSSRSTVQLGTASRAGSVLGAINVGNWSTLAVVNADMSGTTIANNSGYVSFYNTSSAGSATITNDTFGSLSFNNASTAGSATITNDGGLLFANASTAGNATIANNGNMDFYNTSTAGNAIITNNAPLNFFDASNAGTATITNNSSLSFYTTSSAGRATITTNVVGTLDFYNTSTAGSATITNNGGMSFRGTSTAGSATIINTGTLGFENASTAGNATITNNNDMFFGNSSTAGSATITNTGNLTFSGSSRAGSATITNSGALLFSHISNADSANITNNGTLDFVQGATAGNAALINNAGGIVYFSASLGPAMDHRLSAGSIAGAGNYILGANELTVGSNNLSTTVSGVISGTGGRLVKTGTGTLTLTGINTYTGGTTVSGGTLVVNGSIVGALNILTNGRLQGTGTVGDLTVSGTIAPGNSIGTLNIAGNATFGAGTNYQVEINPAGQSDRIIATGTATISGGTVSVLAGLGPTKYAPQTLYTILTAGGGITGTFAGVTSNLAFLDPTLSYDANNVYLTMARNDANFASIGRTRNQIATGGALNSLGWGNPLYDTILGSSASQAQHAFDQLSGEVHASAKTALIEDSRFVRNAVNDRMRSAFDARTSGTVTTYESGAPATAKANTDRFALWGQAFGSWGRAGSDGNAARLSRQTGGFLFGADAPVLNTWRLGAIAGYSQTSFGVTNRSSSGSSDNYSLGLYGGGVWSNVALRMGASYTLHDITSNRSVAFPGFSGSHKSDYKAATAQVFGELAYGLDIGRARFEPFANFTYVNFRNNRFTEQGGAAALNVAAVNTAVAFTTLGLRTSTTLDIAGTTLTARGMLGWRHASGDVTPHSAMRFASGGNAFTIGGAPIARNAALIEAGLDYALTPNATLGLIYGGQFGARTSDQSGRFNVNVKF